MLTKITQGEPFVVDKDDIKVEPMLFSATPNFALEAGGFITRTAVNYLTGKGHFSANDNVVIDTRVHMLKRGMFPAIGGWHCDAVPRGADGQPDFSQTDVIDNIRHYLLVVDSGTGSVTEFLTDATDLSYLKPPTGKNTWGTHSELIARCVVGNPDMVTATESGHLYQFSARDYHRAVPATGNGWRFFFRASVNTQTKGPFNEIRKQVQVYLPTEHLGW